MQSGADVQVVIVVEHPYLGGQTGRPPVVVGLILEKTVGRFAVQPALFVQTAIDMRRHGDTQGIQTAPLGYGVLGGGSSG